MLHDLSFTRELDRAAALNRRAKGLAPEKILDLVLRPQQIGRVTLVSSFGAESVVLLHMAATIDRTIPILFLDTQMLFPETLTYQVEVAQRLGLTDIRVIRPNRTELVQEDPDGVLNHKAHDACCALRKTRPLLQALKGFDTWITGRKRFQSGARATLETFETDDNRRLKVNPLAHWGPQNLQNYIRINNLPTHPLLSQGFPSIGCAPCTSSVQKGEDVRAGRWRGSEKTECGIHFPSTAASTTALDQEISQ